MQDISVKPKFSGNVVKRIKLVKAMEYIVRNVNAEDITEQWLIFGVADGDIDYGDLTVAENPEDDEAFWYVEKDETFSEIMELFLDIMACAKEDGGLYCDGVVSKQRYTERV